MNYKTALLVGRFQPFHKGHLYLVKKALKEADKLIIGIGSSNITDVNNPLDYETRRKIIKAVIYKEKLENKVLKIMPLDDFFDDEKWRKNVESKAGQFDLVIGNNKWTNKILEKAGYKILLCPYFKRYLYEGWRIRELIKKGEDFKDRVPSYLYSSLISSFQFPISNENFKFKHVVLGGTFDRLHSGHKALIKKALEIGKKITIGLATKALYKNKFLSQIIEPYKTRKKNLKNFIREQLEDDRRVAITPILDIYGTTLEDNRFEAIVVSRETLPNALKINEKRSAFVKTSTDKEKLKPLQIIVIEDVLADDGKIVSSERIRRGEIDREGRSYQIRLRQDYGGQRKELILPENLREKLRKPIGSVITSFSTPGVERIVRRLKKASLVISVGDIISTNLIGLGIQPDIMIVDFKSRRKPISEMSKLKCQMLNQIQNSKLKIINNPGTINLKAVEEIKKTINGYLETGKKSTIVIDGEEDLLTLPAILFAPLGSVVCYGQWDKGAVIVQVTEKKKKEVQKILEKFV